MFSLRTYVGVLAVYCCLLSTLAGNTLAYPDEYWDGGDDSSETYDPSYGDPYTPPVEQPPSYQPPAETQPQLPPQPTTPTTPTYTDPSPYPDIPNPVKGAVTLKILSNGDAKAPKKASKLVRKMVAAANRINSKRYLYGGAHGSAFFNPNPKAFDCSSAVSYVLYAAGLVNGPFDSRGLMHWGKEGAGKQLTVYSNRTHAFMVIGNLRFDTGRAAPIFGKQSSGPRWGLLRPTQRFKVRHIPGL